MMRPIYLDHNSTTPLDPEVFEVMRPFFTEKFGNEASSTHTYGWEAHEAVEVARESIARLIGTTYKEGIIFTSGATESNNLAIKGILEASKLRPAHIITQKTEHKCVLDSCTLLESRGHEATYLDVDSYGLVNPSDVRKNIRPNTVLCSIMYANNEIGTIQPIREIASICHEKGVLFHSDAVQAVGKIPLDVEKEGIDLMSLSGHKIYGPKGIGALYAAKRRPPLSLEPILHGGGHEGGKRSGTLNVPGIVGLAKALEICVVKREEEGARLSGFRDYFINKLTRQIDQIELNGHPTLRLPNNINLTIEDAPADELIMALPEAAFSTGSACSSGAGEPSYVIRALGIPDEKVLCTVRFGLGRWTTQEEIDWTLEKLIEAVKKLRKQSLKYEMKIGKGN